MLNEKPKSKIDKNFKIYISILLLVITYSMLFIFWDLLTQYDTAIFLEICEDRIPDIESFFVLWTNAGTSLFMCLIVTFCLYPQDNNP